MMTFQPDNPIVSDYILFTDTVIDQIWLVCLPIYICRLLFEYFWPRNELSWNRAAAVSPPPSPSYTVETEGEEFAGVKGKVKVNVLRVDLKISARLL